jgi:hypothetical protein
MKTQKALFATLAIILLSACDNTNGIVPPLEESPITVTADVTQHTRTGYESGVLMPEKFVMDITQGDDTKYNYSLVEMTKSSTGNTYSAPEGTDLLWADDTHAATVKAMTIPMGLTAVDAESVMEINVSLEQNDAENVAASDLLGATSETNGGITIESTTINVEFQHLLSKLDVTYEFSSEFDENAVVINSLTLQNICTTGGFSYADMAYDATNLEYGDIAMYLSTSTSTAEVIFFPYAPTENPTLLINATIDDVEYNFTCPVVPKDANGFVGGKRYTMNVSIIGSSVSGTEATIAKGWDTETEGESFVTES